MNLNTEKVNEALEQAKKIINQIMIKYELDYNDKIGEHGEREIKSLRYKSPVEVDLSKYIKKEVDNFGGRFKTICYFEKVIKFKTIKNSYWSIYRYFENEIELLNINMNVKRISQLKNKIDERITILGFDYERKSPEYLDLDSLEYKHPELITFQGDIKISQSKYCAIELFEIEGKVKLLQYIIDNFLSPERSGPKKKN
jgi:hypothetical protein